MPEIKLGPYVRAYIAIGLIIAVFLGGVYTGWQGRGSWGINNKVAVLIGDSEHANDIREAKAANQAKVDKQLENINEKKITDCGRIGVADQLGLFPGADGD